MRSKGKFSFGLLLWTLPSGLLLHPVHVAFLEFVIDPACSIVFEAEEGDAAAMERPPRDPREPLFSAAMLRESLVLGIALLVAVALAYAWEIGRAHV